MREDQNTLDKAIEAIKSRQIPPEPPQELVAATVTKLAEAQHQSGKVYFGAGISLIERLRAAKNILRVAAAAVLLIGAGYGTGRLSAPPPPDMEQLEAALEPVIRDKVIAELKSDLRVGLADCYVSLKDELDRRYSEDMRLFAAETLAASNSVINDRLTKLTKAIDAAQTEDRQWVTAALEQIELDRLRDNAQLGTVFVSFAMRTEDELQRTKQGVAQLLAYGMPEDSNVFDFKNSDNPDERRNK